MMPANNLIGDAPKILHKNCTHRFASAPDAKPWQAYSIDLNSRVKDCAKGVSSRVEDALVETGNECGRTCVRKCTETAS